MTISSSTSAGILVICSVYGFKLPLTASSVQTQEAHKDSMKVPRASVEWGFKGVKQICSSLDFPRKLKVREAPVGLPYKIDALVWNLRCCFYSGATSTFFKCAPPSVEDYLGSGGHDAEDDA